MRQLLEDVRHTTWPQRILAVVLTLLIAWAIIGELTGPTRNACVGSSCDTGQDQSGFGGPPNGP